MGDPEMPTPEYGPCAEDRAPANCGLGCTGDSICGPGLHCGSEGLCTAECTLLGGQCGPGQECNNLGHCVVAQPRNPGNDGQDCPRLDVGLTAITPTVIFLLDRSGSMGKQRFGSKFRWDAVEEALVAESGGVVTELAGRVIFGAAAYNNNMRGACPDMLEVPFALDNRAAIAELMGDNRPDGATPTGNAFHALLDALAATPPPADSPTIIILATDGEPDTCEDPLPDSPDDLEEARAAAVAGAQAAFDQGYRTYVLSVGADIATEHLQDMANAGAGLPLDTPDDAPFFVANDQAQVVAALEQIITDERSCELAVDNGTVDASRAAEGKVLLNGTPLAFESEWILSDDGKHIVLVGDACDSFLHTPSVELEASFPCGVIVE